MNQIPENALTLKLLLLEDNPDDAELILRELQKAGIHAEYTRVDTKQDYCRGIKEGPDLILADYNLLDFNASTALEILKAEGLQEETPFIVISGSIGEELAVEILKQGAFDYILKDRMTRLGQAVHNSIKHFQQSKENRKAEQFIRESEERFRQVVEHIQEVFYMFDPLQNRMLYVSPAYERIWGNSTRKLYATPDSWLQAVHPDDKERVRERTKRGREGGFVEEYRIVRPDGSFRWVRDQSYPIQDTNGRVYRIVGVAEDISERKAAEQALIQQDRQLIETQEIAHIGGWEWDVVKDTLRWTPEMYRLLGLEPNAVAPPFEEYLEFLPTTDREQLRALARESFETRQGFDLNHRIIRSDGQTRIVYARVEVVTDATGKVIRMRGTTQDVTAQRKLEEQLMQAQKLEAIGRLSGGVAHDFNNILTIIMGQLSLLEDHHFDGDIAESIHHIKSATHRAASLTRQLLLFSRKEKVEMHEVELINQMRETIKMLARLLGEDVSITFHTNETQIPVLADPGMLDQIIMNLAVNARDAMPLGGRLIFEAGIRTFDHLSAQQSAQIREGTFACLTITDNGTGIPEDVLPNIFDPFFTTKSVEKGTGLGLSTVMGIVQQHNGWISVYTEASVGTTFRIFLPIFNSANNDIHTQGVFMNESGGAETILLVEDEDTIRKTLSRYLERQGYTVLTAGNGNEALQIWQESQEQIELVITDVIMPGGMNGVELTQTLLQDRPNVKVIYVSGFSALRGITGAEFVEGENFVSKPYTLADLGRTLRKVLDS